MATRFTVGDVVELRTFSYMINQIGINRVRYRVTANTGLGATDEEFATAQSATLAPLYQNVMSAAANFLGVQAQIFWPVRRNEVTVDADAGAGTGAGDPLPPQCAALIGFKTAVATRAGRGRIYVPFMYEDVSNADARPTAPQIVALQALAAAWVLPVTVGVVGDTSTLRPVVAKVDGSQPIDIVDFRVRPYWVTQRRRSYANRGDQLPF